MTIATDKTAQSGGGSQPDSFQTSCDPKRRGGAAQCWRMTSGGRSGRGLESLLPGPRPAGGGLGTAGSGSGSPGSGPASGGSSGSVAAVSGDVGASAGAPVPGVIAELQAQAARKLDGHEVLDLLITSIDVNPHQTRSWTRFEVESLEELADSIRAQGVLQPVTVRPGKDGRYFLITGERRLRASTMAEQNGDPDHRARRVGAAGRRDDGHREPAAPRSELH